MSNRSVYVAGLLLAVVQIASTAYFTNRPEPERGTEGWRTVTADRVQQVLWDGSMLHIDLADTQVAPENVSIAHITLDRVAAETLFRNLAQIHGARPAPAPAPKPQQF